MAKRKKLSPLQKEYRKFFKKRLKDFEIKSPAELDKEKKRDFFGDIPPEWKEKKDELSKNGKIESWFPKKNKSYSDSKGNIFVVSSIKGISDIELVEVNNAANIINCNIYTLKDKFTPVTARIVTSDEDSPLNIALIETSEIVATLNSLMRTVLITAPNEVKTAARAAIVASKKLLQKLASEIRED